MSREKDFNTTPILVVEDSPEDYEALKRAFQKNGLGNPLFHCEDGDQGLDYIYRRGGFQSKAGTPLPGLILLDLNLPGTDGFEVLQQLKRDEKLRDIPVIVMTTSGDPNDIKRCYDMGANSYVQKPVTVDGFLEAVKRLSDFWFGIVLLPDKSAA